jgi:hypothetical protein
MSTPAFYHSARRQALAERHRPREEMVSIPGGRLHGRCSKCQGVHRSPDVRYGCPDCPGVWCVDEARAQGFCCPGCGSRLEMGPEEPRP